MANIHFKKHLIHQCLVQRTTPVQSTSGELIDVWADVGTIDCRFVQKQEAFANESQGFMMMSKDMLLVNNGEDVIEEDRIITITFKSDGSSVDTGPFTVESFLGRNSTGAHHISLMLERVE